MINPDEALQGVVKTSVKDNKTIEAVVKEGLCTGCGTCAGMCPVAAIDMIKCNSKGTYVPLLDRERCTQCGICLEVCPGHSVDFEQLNVAFFAKEPEDTVLGNYLNCHTGYATDREIRYHSASGGLVTALLIFALEEGLIDGALVTRMSQENPLEPQPFVARTREEIVSASKSKYCPVPANVALREILSEDGRYAVVGLPCHIQGIRKAEEANKTLRDRIVLHLGIFCAHTVSFTGTEFLLWKRHIAQENIIGLDYRGEGWPGGMSIYLNDGSRVFVPYLDVWRVFNPAFYPLRCTLCCDGASELADISFGDAWLPEFSDDESGTSAIVSRIPKGEELLQHMAAKGSIKLNGIAAARIAESQQDFRPKKAGIKVYMAYARMRRRRIPAYNTRLGKPKPVDIMNSLLNLLGLYLSSKRCLWRSVSVLYLRLFPFLGKFRRFLKSLLPSVLVRR